MSVFPDELEVRETLPKECFAYQDWTWVLESSQFTTLYFELL